MTAAAIKPNDAANPPALTEENAAAAVTTITDKVESDAEQTEEQDDTMANTTHRMPPELFLKGLVILPPRQNTNSNNVASEVVTAATVALPPLRPEEPVASIRAALSEVLGYAHLTKYRLVVERVDGRSGVNGVNGVAAKNGASAGGAATAAAPTSSTGGGGGAKGKKKGGNSNSNSSSNSSSAGGGGGANASKEWQNDNVVSPFTLKNAMVTIPPSVKSLEEHSTDTKKARNGEEEELILDDYGDLSVLLPLLLETNTTLDNDDDNLEKQQQNNQDPTTNNNNNNNNTTTLDASTIAIRVVLERYDLASVRDHLVRVRQLMEGNAPHVTSLVVPEEEVVLVEEQKKQVEVDEKKEENEADAVVVVEGEGGEKEQGKEEKDGKSEDDQDKQPEKEATTTPEEKKEEEKKAREELAKSLPTFPVEYDLSFSNVTTGGDLANFYYLACGEEKTLLRLKEEAANQKKQGKQNGSSHNTKRDSWLDDTDGKGRESTTTSTTKKSNNRNNKSNKKKANNNNNNNNNNSSNKADPSATNANGENHVSLVETERRLHELNAITRIASTIRLSGYHAPPSHRRVLGDLAYLEAILPGGSIVHITAFPLGYYVNRSTSSTFDPTPAKDPCYSHALLDCLLQRSKPLRMAWLAALSASLQRAELVQATSLSEDSFMSLFRPAVSGFDNNGSGSGGGGIIMSAPSTFTPRVDSIVMRPPWLVNLPSANDGDNMVGPKRSTWNHGKMHEWNPARAEEELTSTFGMDVRGGGLRDWNEELQSAREMPVETLGERIERARLVHKVMSDFGDAALIGAKSIFDGYIMPMNPNESTRSHVYLHNNIFFSRAVDAGLETLKICQGDNAAKKSASRDAHNMGVLHRLDIPGLHTLATVLVDYLGTRFVCQSIVPGILYGEKAHTLTYGAVEALSELQCDEDMHKLLESSIGEGCMVATRTIPSYPLSDEKMDYIKENRTTPLAAAEEEAENEDNDAKNKTISACGPVEMKGILGSDKRKYVLDCTRLTPRDANWVAKTSGGNGYWEDIASEGGTKTSEHVPTSLDDDEWIMCVLRPELVTSYAEMKITKFLRERVSKKSGDAAENSADSKEASTLKGDEPSTETENKEASSAKDDRNETKTAKSESWEVVETKESLAKAEDEYIRSLQYNVNVFLPCMRSIENIDKDAHEQLKKDEEEARELARHLWGTVLPALTKDIRLSSGSGLQVPADGKCLTEFIHQRGINCRYLGRLAELARNEEQNDLEAEKSFESKNPSAKLQRFKMPLSWLELLECEMVARAAKHVLDSYTMEQGGASAAQPAQTIASFLSAVVSVGEESAAETEIRTSNSGGDALDEDDMNALTMFDVGGSGDAVPSQVRGRRDVWSDIEREVGRRYRYTLSLYNSSDLKSKDASKSRALFTPLLRRICQRSGIRLVGKCYDVGGKCVCGGGNSSSGRLTSSYPIAPVDILDILPLVKHAAAVAGETFMPCAFNGSAGSPSLHVLLSDAKSLYEHGHAHMNSGNLPLALDYAQEAAAMYQRVVETPLHTQISRCLKLTSAAHFHGQEHELSIASASKYLAVSVSLGGFDCMDTLNAHMNMSNTLLAAGKIQQGLKHLRAMQFLMEIMAGPNYSEISSTYYKIGAQYYEVGRIEDALRFYQLAAKSRNDDRMIDCIIARSTAMALARLGRFKEAYDVEKESYQSFLGEEHEATKSSRSAVLQFMQLAVEQGKVNAVKNQKLSEELAADLVADQIKADEDADDATKKKKKNKKKKKKAGQGSE